MNATPHGCVFVAKQDIDQTLATPATAGKRLLEPLKMFATQNKLPLNILEDKEIENEAEIHEHEADLWYCLEGEVRFIVDGEMVEPFHRPKADGSIDEREWKAKQIKNGQEIKLTVGDWLWIPAGQPHQHICEGTARLAIIKIPKT